MLPPSLHNHLDSTLPARILAARPLSGGDIHRAYRLELENGQNIFIKTNQNRQAPEMFRTESLGLKLLGQSQAIRIPDVIGHRSSDDGHAYLMLEYIEPGHRNAQFWERFGRKLARLHKVTSAQFGLDHDNFIGSLPQSNTQHSTWAEFYTEERLLPQMTMARRQGYFDEPTGQQLHRLCSKLNSVCPAEQPALCHGDLWSGNFLCDTAGEPVLIDPAACYAHREMDLAMTRLFGGFDPRFYDAYKDAWPLEPGFEDRIGIYQLYYLLVHVNLFGGGYVGSVRGILKDW